MSNQIFDITINLQINGYTLLQPTEIFSGCERVKLNLIFTLL